MVCFLKAEFSICPSFLLQCVQTELKKHLPTFLIDPEQQGPLPAGIGKLSFISYKINYILLKNCNALPSSSVTSWSLSTTLLPVTEMVLNTLMNTMSLLRRCRVNPALTIQLFSQLFHFISTWLFNQLMSPEATRGLRSHYWGAALRQRLTAIEGWAERQGLELAADCHLGHIIQVGLGPGLKPSLLDVIDVDNHKDNIKPLANILF